MCDIEWNVENEIQLFYAMLGHKPVGVNKHFQMLMIHDKLSSALNCEISSKTIWNKLETLYDLAALDESDRLPFPNPESDFQLPPSEFSELLTERLKVEESEAREEEKRDEKREKEVRGRGRPPKKDSESESGGGGGGGGSSGSSSSRRDRTKELRDDDDDTTPRRQSGKRSGRDSKPASPANTSSSSNKRRRNN